MLHKTLTLIAETNFGSNLEEQIVDLSWDAVIVGTIALVVLILIAAATINKMPKLKKPLCNVC